MVEEAKSELPMQRVDLQTGTYDIEVVRRSLKRPTQEGSLVRIPTNYGKEISVAVSGNGISVADAGSIAHFTERTLAETTFRSILLKDRFSIVPHNPDSIAEVINQTLQTTSEISPGLEFNPTRYLQSVLEELDILNYVHEDELKNIHPVAAAAFLMDTLGYFRVEKKIDPFTGKTLPDETKEIYRTPQELLLIAQKIDPESQIGSKTYQIVSETFEQVKKIKQATRHSKSNPDALIDALKKPKKERTDKLPRFDLAFAPAYIAIQYNDLFGENATFDFLNSHFRADLEREYRLEGKLKQELTGSGAVFRTPTGEEVDTAIEINMSYSRLKQKLGNALPKRIIETNLGEMELLTGLHFYRDTIIIDPTDTLPLISEYEVIENIHKSKSGEKTKTRHYFLKGREISIAKHDGKTRFFNSRTRLKEKVSSAKEISGKPVLLEFEEEVVPCSGKKYTRKNCLELNPEEDVIRQINDALSEAEKARMQGRKVKVYLCGDELEETRQLRILADHPSAIDAMDMLKKSGDFGKIGILDVGEIGDGIEERINFNDIFLFAKYGVAPRREFHNSESNLLSKLERMVDAQHDLQIEPDNQVKYQISIGTLKLGELLLPENIPIETIINMNLLDALSKQVRKDLSPEERLKADKFVEIYDMLPLEFKMPNEDLEAIQYLIGLEKEAEEAQKSENAPADGFKPVNPQLFVKGNQELIAQTRKSLEGKAHKASITLIDVKRDDKKRYRINRKTSGSEEEYEDLGVIATNNDISRIAGLSLTQYQNISETEREDLINLTRAKFTGIEYSPENGGVWIEKRERLEQVVEKFYQVMGKTAEAMGTDLTFIRITDRARKKFNDRLLNDYQDKELDDDEKAGLNREINLLGINSDQIRKMFFNTEYLLERGLMEPTLSLIAGFVADSHIDLLEGALTEWYINMLEAEKINPDLLAFIHARAKNSVETIEHAPAEIRTILSYVENCIIRDNGGKEEDKNLLRALALLEMPPHQEEDRYTKIKGDYERFAVDLSTRVVHLPTPGESVPQARFFKFYNTTKSEIDERAKKLGEIAHRLTPIKTVFDRNIFFGLGEEDIEKYVLAMLELDGETRQMIMANMSTYEDSTDLMEKYRGKFLKEVNQNILTDEVMGFVMKNSIIGPAFDSIEDAIDSVIPSEEGYAAPVVPREKPKDVIKPLIIEPVFELIDRLSKEYDQEEAEQNRKKSSLGNVTDEDLTDLFGKGNGQTEPPKDETDFGNL